LCGLTLAEIDYESSSAQVVFKNDFWYDGPKLTTSSGAELAAGGWVAWQIEGEGEEADLLDFRAIGVNIKNNASLPDDAEVQTAICGIRDCTVIIFKKTEIIYTFWLSWNTD